MHNIDITNNRAKAFNELKCLQRFLIILYFSRIFYWVSASQYVCNFRITIQFLQLHVSATIFGRHQVVLIQSLSIQSTVPFHWRMFTIGQGCIVFTICICTHSVSLHLTVSIINEFSVNVLVSASLIFGTVGKSRAATDVTSACSKFCLESRNMNLSSQTLAPL